MTSLRIAHLSDLHAEPSVKFDQERITRAALADLEQQHAGAAWISRSSVATSRSLASPMNSPLWERSHNGDRGNSRLMSFRVEVRGVAGSFGAERAT